MKNNKNKKIIERQYKNNDENNEFIKILKITIGVLLFFGIVYLIAGVLTGEIKFNKDEKEEVSIQYSEILAESTFKQKDNEYYVIYYDFSSNESVLIDAITNDLSANNKVYKVDLSKGFNKNYISKDDKIKTNPKNAKELTVVNPTLIKIKNKKSVKLLKGAKNIKEYVIKLK